MGIWHCLDGGHHEAQNPHAKANVWVAPGPKSPNVVVERLEFVWGKEDPGQHVLGPSEVTTSADILGFGIFFNLYTVSTGRLFSQQKVKGDILRVKQRKNRGG